MPATVLIPARGKCEYLIQTLESLRSSTVSPGEIILVDDGVISKLIPKLQLNFQDLSLRILQNNGRGIVDALNTGVSASKFPLIARLDADDLMMPERLAKQEQEFQKIPDLVLIGGNAIFIDQFGNITGQSDLPVGELNNHPDFGIRCLISHPTVMFRKESFFQVKGYRSIYRLDTYDLAEDFDLWLRLSKLGKVMNLEDKIIKYRQHSSQITSRFLVDSAVATLYASALNTSTEKGFYNLEPIIHKGSEVIISKVVWKTILAELRASRRIEFMLMVWSIRNPTKFVNLSTKVVVRGSRILRKLKLRLT
jgi:glycosyltransferase involved in cell wall biosynthesis